MTSNSMLTFRPAITALVAAGFALAMCSVAQAAETAAPATEAASKSKPMRKMKREHVECVATNAPVGSTGDGSNTPPIKKPSGPKCPQEKTPAPAAKQVQ